MAGITVRAAIDAAWMAVEAVRIGPVAATPITGHATSRGSLQAPDAVICLEGDDGPLLRIDLYRSGDECHAFTDAAIWGSLVVIGWGHGVHAVEVRTRQVRTIPLGCYFGHLYQDGDELLIASAERLHAVRPDGSVAWRSAVLGIDGVIVDEIANDVIHGQGEWDPPGGWRDFTISRATGRPAP